MNSGEEQAPDGYLERLESENTRLKEIINNRNAVIKKLVGIFNSYGIEITGLGNLNDEIIEVD